MRSVRGAVVCQKSGLGNVFRQLHVLAFGNGSQGALGLGNESHFYDADRVTHLPPDICSVVCGGFHSVAISSNGAAFAWGRNKEGQLLLPMEQAGAAAVLLPTAVAGPAQGIAIAAASGVCTFLVDVVGQLHVAGASTKGQLGLGKGLAATRLAAVEDLRGQRIRQVACGWGHCLAVTDDGKLFSWGYPTHGRLGHSFSGLPAGAGEPEESALQRCIWQPRPVDVFAGVDIKQVVCGDDHSMVLSRDGILFTFGDNGLGQLGRPAAAAGSDAEPGDIMDWAVRGPDGQPLLFSKVAAGMSHCLGLLQGPAPQLVAWGWNGAGQLGLGKASHEVEFLPSKVELPEDAAEHLASSHVKLAAGRVHSMLLLRGSEGGGCLGSTCYSWGSGRDGRLGHGDQVDHAVPTLIELLEGVPVVGVACGKDHTLLLAQHDPSQQ